MRLTRLLFNAETSISEIILSFQAVLVQFGAVFGLARLLVQPGAGKHDCMKIAQLAQLSHPFTDCTEVLVLLE